MNPPHDPAYLSRPTQWWACHQPERPFDGEIIFDEGCTGCLLKAQLVIRVEGDPVGTDVLTGVAKPLSGWLAEELAAFNA